MDWFDKGLKWLLENWVSIFIGIIVLGILVGALKDCIAETFGLSGGGDSDESPPRRKERKRDSDPPLP